MNVFAKPSAEPNAVRTMPRRENKEWNSTISLSRVQSSLLEFAEARNGAWKWTFSLSQMSRAALARAMPRRENDSWKQTNHFVKPSAIEFTRIAEARNGAWKWRNHRGFPWGAPPPTTVCRSRTVHLSGMPAGSGQRLRKRWIILSERTIFF